MTGDKLLRGSLSLRGGPGAEKVAMAAAAAGGKLAGIPGRRLADIQTAVAEACLNATEHGNRNREKASVRLTFSVVRGAFKVVVKDCGRGFRLEDVATPDIERQLSDEGNPRGWGLYLMRNLADRVKVRPGRASSAVELYFDLGEEANAS